MEENQKEEYNPENRPNSQEKIRRIIKDLKEHNVTKQDLLLNFIQEETPSQIFDEKTIETLERITKHLKEIKKIKPKKKAQYIPITLFSDRTLSALEHIITHLKEHHEMNYKEIAVLLNRDQRTIWTTYQRAKKKRA